MPNAASADSANSANTANTPTSANAASDADAVDGLDSSAFLSSDKATINGPQFVVDDPPGGGPTNVTLMTAGPVTFGGSCTDTGATRLGQVQARASSPGGRLSALIQDDDPATGVLAFQSALNASPLIVLTTPSAAGSAAQETRSGSFSLLHPGANLFRTGNMLASVNVGGDCAFGIAAFG